MGETGTWLAVGFATATALASVLAIVVVALVLRRRRGRPASDREATAETVAELRRELQRTQEETERARRASAVSSSIDLDDVFTETLAAAGALPGVDSAVIVVLEEDAEPIVATLRMSPEEAASRSLLEPEGPSARAVTVAYSYPPDERAENGTLIRGGIVVPLAAGAGERVGTLAVFWRGEDRDVADEELAALEDLAAAAGPAIENALRFRDARKLADLDALTGLHNRRFFHETLAREVARAQRYDRRLALVVFDVDDFKAINDRVGHLAGDAVLAEVADRVRSAVRGADVGCRVGGDEFAVILPESTLADGERLYHRIRDAVGSRPAGPVERVNLSAGIAELQRDDDAVSFFERADVALYRAKEAGKGQVVAADGR